MVGFTGAAAYTAFYDDMIGSLLSRQSDIQYAYEDRLAETCRRGLGLWDIYASCLRQGSLDQAIREPQFNDLAALRMQAPALAFVAHNGGESARAMKQVAALGYTVLRLPSTSPANASWSFDRKLAAWRAAFQQAGL